MVLGHSQLSTLNKLLLKLSGPQLQHLKTESHNSYKGNQSIQHSARNKGSTSQTRLLLLLFILMALPLY